MGKICGKQLIGGLVVSTSVLFLSACALPTTSHHTASTLGTGNWQFDLGYPMAHMAISRGMADNFDLGLSTEVQLGLVHELSGKYRFLDRGNQGLSIAGFAGVYTGATHGIHLGPIFSYRQDRLEAYLTLGHRNGKWDGGSLEDDDSDDQEGELQLFDHIEWDETYYSYLQSTVGFNLWFTEGFALSLSAKHFYFYKSGISSRGVIPTMAFSWKF